MMVKQLTHCFIFLTALMTALLVMADPAFAGQAGNFSCSGGQANGALFTSNISCPTVLNFDNVFSFLVCNMEQLSSNLMGAMFCGMITNLAPAVSAMITFAVFIFGLGFTIGVIPATAREFQLFLLKIAFVWVFATQSDYLLRYGYAFLINGLRDGVAIVLSGYSTTQTGGTLPTVYEKLDGMLAYIIKFATTYIGVDKTSVTADDCKDALFAAMAVLAVAFPPILFLAIALLMRLGITFLRAVFGYVYALVGITFLLCLAPFFLSFYLFKQTRPFFDKWLGYMVSFALQIVILFAFLAAILSFNPSTINTNISDLVMKKSETHEGGSFRAPWTYCTLCDFEVVDKSTNPPTVIPDNKTKDFLGKGSLQCKIEKDTTNPNYGKKTPIPLGATMSPNKGQMSTLIKFVGSGFLALLVLAYVLEGLLAYVPSLAQMLASSLGGASYAPQLGGGINPRGGLSMDVPFGKQYTDFESGFDKGFATRRDGVSATLEGFKRGAETMIKGNLERDVKGNLIYRDKKGKVVDKPSKGTTTAATGKDGNPDTSAGLKNNFIDWLVDPNHLNQQ